MFLVLPVVLPLMWGNEPGVFACLKSCYSLGSLILGFLRCVVILSSRSVHISLGLGYFYSHSLGDVACSFVDLWSIANGSCGLDIVGARKAKTKEGI